MSQTATQHEERPQRAPVNDDGYLGIRLAQLAHTLHSDMPLEHSGVVLEGCIRIRKLEAALNIIASGMHGDRILQDWELSNIALQAVSN